VKAKNNHEDHEAHRDNNIDKFINFVFSVSFVVNLIDLAQLLIILFKNEPGSITTGQIGVLDKFQSTRLIKNNSSFNCALLIKDSSTNLTHISKAKRLIANSEKLKARTFLPQLNRPLQIGTNRITVQICSKIILRNYFIVKAITF
jgi:hypothetical protein